MNIKYLDDQVSVSEQFSCGAMVQVGGEILVCNCLEDECSLPGKVGHW